MHTRIVLIPIFYIHGKFYHPPAEISFREFGTKRSIHHNIIASSINFGFQLTYKEIEIKLHHEGLYKKINL